MKKKHTDTERLTWLIKYPKAAEKLFWEKKLFKCSIRRSVDDYLNGKKLDKDYV